MRERGHSQAEGSRLTSLRGQAWGLEGGTGAHSHQIRPGSYRGHGKVRFQKLTSHGRNCRWVMHFPCFQVQRDCPKLTAEDAWPAGIRGHLIPEAWGQSHSAADGNRVPHAQGTTLGDLGHSLVACWGPRSLCPKPPGLWPIMEILWLRPAPSAEICHVQPTPWPFPPSSQVQQLAGPDSPFGALKMGLRPIPASLAPNLSRSRLAQEQTDDKSKNVKVYF